MSSDNPHNAMQLKSDLLSIKYEKFFQKIQSKKVCFLSHSE